MRNESVAQVEHNKPVTPERQESSSEMSRAVVAKGQEEVKTVLRLIDGVGVQGDPSIQAEAAGLRKEAESAYHALQDELVADSFDEEWGLAPSAPPAPVESGIQVVQKAPDSDQESFDEEWGLTPSEFSAEERTKWGTQLKEILDAKTISMLGLEEVIQRAKSDRGAQSELQDRLERLGGAANAERLLQDAGYREKLSRLQVELAEPVFPNGPSLVKSEVNLPQLMAIDKCFKGKAKELVNAFDFLAFPDTAGRLQAQSTKDVMSLGYVDFDPQGEVSYFTSEFSLFYDVLDKEGQKTKTSAFISRKYSRESVTNEEGESSTKTKINHATFFLPDDLLGGGKAAEVTGKALPLYDEMGVDEVNLYAASEQGGYVWATYGYELDEEPEMVQRLVEDYQKNIEDAYRDAGFEDSWVETNIREPIGKMRDNPESVTAFALAKFGSKGFGDLPVLRNGKSGQWYTEEAFQRAMGEQTEEGENPGKKGSLHVGKIGLMGTSWLGKMDLKERGSRESGRGLLEQKIARARQKNRFTET